MSLARDASGRFTTVRHPVGTVDSTDAAPTVAPAVTAAPPAGDPPHTPEAPADERPAPAPPGWLTGRRLRPWRFRAGILVR